ATSTKGTPSGAWAGTYPNAVPVRCHWRNEKYTSTATTMVGVTYEIISKVRANPASLPVRRFRPTAAAVPTTVASSDAKTATRTELPSEVSQPGFVKKFSYHCNENPLGGNLKSAPALKLNGMTMS